MIVDEFVEVIWSNGMKRYYKNKGYIFTRKGAKFKVKVSDLMDTSKEKVNCICDYCGEPFQREYYSIIKSRKYTNKDACHKKECRSKKMQEVIPKSKFKKENSLLEKYPQIAKEWHYEKNKGVLPSEVSYASNKKYWWICEKGHEWKTSPNSRTNGNGGCLKCICKEASEEYNLGLLYPELIKEWNQEKNKKSIFEFTPKSYKRVWWVCGKCNYEWVAKISDRTAKSSGCPKCNESKGEKTIYNWLTKYNIKFKYQYSLDDCKNIKPLPFDFAVFDDNKLKMLIEYDGEQHFRKVKFYGMKDNKLAEENFKNTKRNDQIKNQYCSKNNIRLLRIPYYQLHEIENILQRELGDLIE